MKTSQASPAVFQDFAEIFRVLSAAGRVRLISALLEAGELCVCDLAVGHEEA